MNSGTPRRQDVDATTDLIKQAGHRLERSTWELARSPEALVEAREALLHITATSARLARQLDGLAAACEQPNSTEPSEVHVALDQAAAAAEDLGNCTKVAAQAIYDGE
ncbi:hypothetical protein SAMN05421805_101370 [Saccharopolyspora antimicrobica]|uniref:Excreted virulence factor EspC, type VII ESX diderm n=1 Tax=Saccharopolyspora antimicrobica TaxID=455193 RepID=A0A1I4R2K1_9PSEU|nr:hypothetical protein [Saccharopolyspora antimicrobica]RKT88192.1 hypothetical protein ATL45_6622 [Saccharopolyspora antimicrobica]SFM46564.1 hypothetical protein SAMN05421805_101370 [Saccharopolyspora antimicrobica]